MIKLLTFSIFLALIVSLSFGQQNKIAFESYNVTEGLPEEFVIDLLQDDQGFIWFSTQNGLVKYDGYQFKVYRSTGNITDTTSLQANNIFGGLLKARDGRIWMGAPGEGVVAFFDPLTEKFRNFYPNSNTSESFNKRYSHLLFEDEAGNIWFKHGKELTANNRQYTTIRLNPTTGEMKEYPLVDIFRGNRYFNDFGTFGTVESANSVWLLDDKSNLHKLDKEKDSFEIIIPAGKSLSTSISSTDTITALSKGTDNRLLLTGRHGLYIFDANTQKIVKNYVHNKGDPNSIADFILGAGEDVKGQIWVIHIGGTLSLIDPVSDNLQTFTYGSDPLYFEKGPQNIRFFTSASQNKDGIWFQAWGEFNPVIKFFVYYQFDTKTFSIYDYNFNLATNPFLKDRPPYHFLEDKTGLLWLGTRPGLYRQAPKKQQMALFRHDPNERNSLPSNYIRYLFEDSKKRLWVGTGDGLAMYQPDQENFQVFRNDPANAASLSNNAIKSINEDADGKIWVATYNGLNQWQESTGNFKRFFYQPGETNRIEFLFPDKKQRLWLSIWNKGVFVLEKNTGRVITSFLPDDKNPSSLSSKLIDIFYQDSRGTIWLGDRNDNQFGLYKLNQDEDGFTHYLHIPGDSTSILSNEITLLAEDGKQRLWIGTDAGLNLYDYAKNHFIRYSDLSDVIAPSITSFGTDTTGEPWFGTYSGGGLVAVDAEKRSFTAYGETKGLLQNDFSLSELMAKDDFGRFWLPTQRGLSVFDPETKSFISYFEKDGFQPYDRAYTAIRTSNGDIWIGGRHGLNHIVPANLLKKDPTLPSIVITQVTIKDSLYSKPDGKIFKQAVSYTDNIILKYWQKDLSFDFVALHYLRSEDNQYSWKLENYDEKWSKPSKERRASYTNLLPGDYIFRIKASNADGVWNEEGISMAITILPPWWLTWWAYAFYSLAFVVVVCLIHLYQKNKVVEAERQKAQIKELEHAKEIEKAYEDLKNTQAQLIQSEKMASLGELTAGIAHEIKNPLNFVNNFSEVSCEMIEELDEEIEKGDKIEARALSADIKRNLNKIILHGKRADAVVKGMLEHSKRGSGQKELTNLNALADEFLRLSYQSFLAKEPDFKCELKTNLAPDLPKVSVIPQDIGKVLLNLMNNAFYACAERSRSAVNEKASSGNVDSDYKPIVTVSSAYSPLQGGKGGRVELSVQDNGSGIPDSIKEKIFQPFFTTKPTGSGTGLGLSLSYDIVKAHGGKIKMETNEGFGTEFTIFLPLI